jgi:hypothetical protein
VAFARRGLNDRHHFRFIVSPKDAAEMIELKAFTRDLAIQMESDLGTTLDWVGIAHWNTDNPHVHLLVRVSRRTAPISSSPATTSATICGRGPRTWTRSSLAPSRNTRSVRRLHSEVDTERWTRLDRAIRMAALVATGLDDELTGEAYAVIDGTDGRAHHVRFQGSRRAGGIVEVRRFGGPDHGRFDFAPRKFSSLNFTVFTVFTVFRTRAGVQLPKILRADGEDGEI